MVAILRSYSLRRFLRSKVALALPVTFLILLASTIGIISVTYYFSIERITSQSQNLKVSTAKQNFLFLDDVITSTLWQPGSSGTFDLADSGGLINIQPISNLLTVRVTSNSGIDETIFNASIGKITYELPYSSSSETGLYLKGDSRTITNQSGSSPSQLWVANGAEHPEIQLCYRPTVSFATGGFENGEAVNTIRIYIVNLNSSNSIASQGELPLKISCINTQLTTTTIEALSQSKNLAITSLLEGVNGSVSIPISSTSEGSIIYIETVISNVSIQRSIL